MRIETTRLILRSWTDDDRAPFAALNADPEVMRYFPAVRSREESDALVDKLLEFEARDGFAFCAVERKADAAFIGMIGIATVDYLGLPFEPTVEVGWRLARPFWGEGYATEGAVAALAHGFDALNLPEIVAFTATINLPSQAVMHRLGMSHDAADDFDHPRVPAGHVLSRHVLYRKRRPVSD
ncbi:GNAT family N-acetyltransferase [Oryzibacter oryziterrae]|uniref:GNAT family N-acetyltransferase n=1 Tax=Oryzibacter oryziterrae TaxID=2766474 RepID=UPI001F3DABB8|nr:GNAT family N-acetyltransferase [Oryzibacter oryziterrae]